MDAIARHRTLDEWELIERLLPDGWREKGRELGALTRARNIPDAGVLLRVLLVHLADGCSLAETAARAAHLGWCELSPAAVFKRLRASERWLGWMAEQMWRARGADPGPAGRRVRAADATAVTESGRTGSEYRIHYALDLSDLRCDYFEVTSHRVGESLRRLPVRQGDIILADRGLALAPGMADLTRRGAGVIARMSVRNLPLFSGNGRRFDTLAHLRRLRVGRIMDQDVWVHAPGTTVQGRCIAVRRSARATGLARRRLVRKAQKNGNAPPSRDALDAAGYFVLFTSLGRDEMPPERALELYRLRWQIELTFKRGKSILGLGQLPKRSDPSSRAWLNGKLLVAMLVEEMIRDANAFSPWGYPLDATQPMA